MKTAAVVALIRGIFSSCFFSIGIYAAENIVLKEHENLFQNLIAMKLLSILMYFAIQLMEYSSSTLSIYIWVWRYKITCRSISSTYDNAWTIYRTYLSFCFIYNLFNFAKLVLTVEGQFRGNADLVCDMQCEPHILNLTSGK